MLNPNWRERLAVPLRTLQIVVVALALGCIAFMAIVLFMVGSGGFQPAAPEMPVISYLALAFVALILVVRIVVGTVIVGQGCAKIARADSRSSSQSGDESNADDLAALVQIHCTKTIVGAALFEGVSFFLLIAYLVEGLPIVLDVAMATIVCIPLHFPTSGRMAYWIESKSDFVDQQRQFGR